MEAAPRPAGELWSVAMAGPSMVWTSLCNSTPRGLATQLLCQSQSWGPGTCQGLDRRTSAWGLEVKLSELGQKWGLLAVTTAARGQSWTAQLRQRTLEWHLRGLLGSPWHTASPLPSSLPTHAHCPPARLAISFGFDTSYLSPPQSLHPPTYPSEALRVPNETEPLPDEIYYY